MKTLLLLLLLSVGAYAGPITFTNAVTTYTLPAGFFQSNNAPNDKWQYFVDFKGAGVRIMLPMSSTLTPDTSGNIETFWAAQLNDIPFDGELTFSTKLDICDGRDCASVVISGALRYGTDGLVWSLPPAAQSFALGSTLYYLQPALSTRTGVVIPRDTGFNIRPAAEVPEPATLTLLGLGLAGLANRLRKRKDNETK